MIRVLHLLDTHPDFQTARCAGHLLQEIGGGVEGEAREIGAGGDWRGVAGAVAGIRRLVEFDVVHAWGPAALSAAVLGTRLPIVHSPRPDAQRNSARWMRALMSYRAFETVCPTSSLRRALVTAGVPLERCHLIRPGVEFKRIRRRRDRDLRDALGFTDNDRVFLAAGESTEAAAHADAVWACSILHVLDPRNRLLLWGRGNAITEAIRFSGRLKNSGMLRVAEQRLRRKLEFEELLPASDIVLNTSSGAVATLPLSMCMAAGLPIVSTVTYTASELLEDRHTALMTPRRSPRVMAQRCLMLAGDPELQWRLSDMARTEAFEYFSLTRFLEQWRGVYRQCAASQPVKVTEPDPGAGLRFHGRG